MRDINFAFNWFYVDDRDIAWTLSGWYPKRARGTHPDLPAWGTGEWDWRGFDQSDYSSKRMPVTRLPHGLNPAQGYLVNWNNKQAPGWRAADDYWRLLDAWVREGSHRRDVDGDNAIEHAAEVAVMDDWWPLIARGVFQPVLGRTVYDAIRDVHGFGSPPPDDGSAFGSGWWSEVHTDLRSLVGAPVRAPLSRPYCGRGKRARCRRILLAALTEAVANAKARYGVQALGDIRMEAVCDDGDLCDEIVFTTAGAVGMPDIPWQDRPTFQQIVEIQGHRPR
jgi:hypothetical protein